MGTAGLIFMILLRHCLGPALHRCVFWRNSIRDSPFINRPPLQQHFCSKLPALSRRQWHDCLSLIVRPSIHTGYTSAKRDRGFGLRAIAAPLSWVGFPSLSQREELCWRVSVHQDTDIAATDRDWKSFYPETLVERSFPLIS